MSLLGVTAALLVSREHGGPLVSLCGPPSGWRNLAAWTNRWPRRRTTVKSPGWPEASTPCWKGLSAFRQRETEFVRHASHEFRTPLAALRAQMDANAQGWISDAELIATVDQQVERLTALTGALLLLSRENGTEHEGFDLAELSRALTQQHGAAYCGPAQCLFSGSRALLTQVLTNLLGNVQKYAPGAAATVITLVHPPRRLSGRERRRPRRSSRLAASLARSVLPCARHP